MPKLTMAVFSGDMDRAIASFLIASWAAVEGWDVTMFFTFWGLGIIRDPAKKVTKKVRAEKTFDFFLPKGADDLKLSQMHMLGFGTSMMKKRMTAKNMLSVREMMKEAKEFGVKFIACNLPMELMGIKEEELVEEIDETCSVGRFLQESKDADMTLFI